MTGATTEKTIAYIKIGQNSHTNRRVGELLVRHFPEWPVRTFDVTHDLFGGPLPAALFNAWAAWRAYGVAGLTGRRPGAFYTPRYFQRVRELLHRHIRPADYVFSFQTQSLFDASVEGLPHFVYTDHTHLANLDYPDFDRRHLAAPAWIELEKTIYRRATCVFTMSTNIRRSVIEQYDCPADKVVCVYGGANTMPPADAPAPAYGSKTILFVGVDWERKGGPDLLAAFQRVRAARPDARLVIVGCAPPVTLSGITVVGRVPLDAMERYYRETSVFCLPTRREPFGIAFIEAMLRKLPVVGTTVGGVPDFIIPGETGCLVPPGDGAALTDALLHLLDDPARCRAYGESGYRLASARYTWDQVGLRLRAEIDRALEGGKG